MADVNNLEELRTRVEGGSVASVEVFTVRLRQALRNQGLVTVLERNPVEDTLLSFGNDIKQTLEYYEGLAKEEKQT